MLILSLLMACDRDGTDFWVQASDVDDVQDLGIIDPIPAEEVVNNPAGEGTLTGLPGLQYRQLGAPPDPSNRGGATFQFFGTGGSVCLVVDPETVFWNQDISIDPNGYKYQDNLRDDGDLDMSAGLSAYYTGSPGVSIGDFELPYTDPLGQVHTIDFNLCNRAIYPSGRGTVESCEIDTSNQEGISFTVLLKTFSLPINDGILSYGLGVVDGGCANVTTDECAIPFEADDGDATGPHANLESQFCQGPRKVNEYCEDGHIGGKDADCSEGTVQNQ